MAIIFIKEAVLLFILWIVYTQVKNWLRWRALKKFGDKHGCGEIPTAPNKLPGGLERYGVLFRGLKGFDFLEDMIRSRFASVGNTHRVIGLFNSSIVSTVEPENIQAILATKFQDFDLGPARRHNFHEMLGNGIFTAEGEAWQHFRNQLKPQFTRDQVSDLEAADRHLQILFKALPDEDKEGWIQKVDIMPLFYNFTMDVSTEFLFGESTNSQSNTVYSKESGNTTSLQEDMDFTEAMNFAGEYVAWRIRLRSLYWLASSKRFRNACRTVKDFADGFVRVALDPTYKRNPVNANQKEKYVLLDALVTESSDPVELRDQVLHLLLAGRDTTSALLSWTILLLGRHPEEFTKLRSAIISHFGTAAAPTQELTFTSLKACKAVTHVLYETMRLYPLIPLNGRECLRDTILPTGGGKDGKQPIAVRKGEQLGYSAYVMHRRKDIWGEDCEEFHPERWEGRKLGWEYIPFSGGPRVCLGQQYALNEAAFVIVKILQRFDSIEALDKGPIKKSITLTLSPGDGGKIKMHKATA